MYGPAPFLFEDTNTAITLIDEIVMGTLIAPGETMEGSPLPFMTKQTEKGGLKLIGHMDRANPLWRLLDTSQQVLVVFWGPNTYISPSYYTSQPRVPTWAYATVHAHGTARLLVDETDSNKIVTDLGNFTEKPDSGWDIDQVTDYKQKLLKGIVGFEIDILRVQSQIRLLQTNNIADRASVYRSLAGGSNAERQTAELMDKLGFAVTD